MIDVNYIIIKAEENNVKIVLTKSNNEENIELLSQGEVLILNLKENIISFKIIGKARIVSKLDQVISG
ncbi:trp RNA-binding attenuation protein MtrB [Gemelliphila palaticanis]|uniref:Trp RNA-binding attenuation protein MtrB n=1 Tax=Gemelliphila palaticanis TaxID=81950 RepID=A0ABX2T062_9BACL|nr:trp RNA-binding attenuation protein MtrB [Gemella palaticanis]MBF0716010.1 trp RNA-binding attenuation protein MtrB [Gemella palaticanis]NYS47940.1 trp RNA-binding attenuation protein MtrB [Gemella palaticanis]